MAHYENNFEEKSCNKEFIQALTDTAKIISACGKNIQKTIESINQSCNTPGTRGATHKRRLQVKVEEMKKLVVLYDTAARKLINEASKITNGIPMEGVLSEVTAFEIFYTDQLKREEYDLLHILSIIQPDFK